MDCQRYSVLDTNVLLADPQAIYAFPDACVVIPETVLAEIDKLKTGRADQDLRYRGREVSRELFGLSEAGALTEGVALKNGGFLMVARFDPDAALPPEFNQKSSDDRILAVAFQLAEADEDVTLVTNDLNMLLKAQAMQLPVRRYGDESERPLLARVTRTMWQRNRIPILTAMAVVVAFVAVLIVLRLLGGVSTPRTSTLPPEFERMLGSNQRELLSNLQTLQQDPEDLQALIALGNLYYDEGVRSRNSAFLQKASTYYERALELSPKDPAVGTDLAVTYYYLGRMNKAVDRIRKVIADNPGFSTAYFNYAVFLQHGKKDLENAAKMYRKFLSMVPPDSQLAPEARARLDAVETSLTLQKDTQTSPTGDGLPGLSTGSGAAGGSGSAGGPADATAGGGP